MARHWVEMVWSRDWLGGLEADMSVSGGHRLSDMKL